MNINKFKSDINKATNGVWVPLWDGRVKIARADNKNYRKAFAEKLKPYRREVQNKSLPDETLQRIVLECFAETILLDWEGFEEDDKPLPYSKEKVIEIMSNEQFEDLALKLYELSKDHTLFLQEEEQEDIKKD